MRHIEAIEAIADTVIEDRQELAVEFVKVLQEKHPDVYEILRNMTVGDCFRELIYSVDDLDFVTCSSIYKELHKDDKV